MDGIVHRANVRFERLPHCVGQTHPLNESIDVVEVPSFLLRGKSWGRTSLTIDDTAKLYLEGTCHFLETWVKSGC